MCVPRNRSLVGMNSVCFLEKEVFDDCWLEIFWRKLIFFRHGILFLDRLSTLVVSSFFESVGRLFEKYRPRCGGVHFWEGFGRAHC